MRKARLNSTERKALILESARRVFSEHGYGSARTQEIARGAGISEALMYRHFPSKAALYRAVLRQTIREQNQNYDMLQHEAENAEGMVRMLQAYFRIAASQEQPRATEGFRLLLASLAGDGSFAALVYRRSLRMTLARTIKALNRARADEELGGQPIDVANTSMFIEHVGTMLSTICALMGDKKPYTGDVSALVRDATRFCCRGLGFSDAVIDKYLQA